MKRRTLVISGLSGSGKSIALHALEDLGYYCVDNLPAALLTALVDQLATAGEGELRLAIGMDSRAGVEALAGLPALMEKLPGERRLLFLTADDPILIQRFSETRRRHPLSKDGTLTQAIAEERRSLEPLHDHADQIIDTSETNIHQLRQAVWNFEGALNENRPATIMLQSFGFKHGIPREADLVFDARCLPNPHWVAELRAATGLENEVRQFLEAEPRVLEFRDDIERFLTRWLSAWTADLRSQLTCAIGCTGGRHRSVYLVDSLARRLRANGLQVVVHHRELGA